MSTSTSNYGFILPAVNSPTDADLWGGELNANISEQDALFLTSINFVTSAPTTSFSVTAPTIGSSVTGNSHQAFLCNATGGAIVPTLPAATAAGNGYTVAFKKTDSSANAVTLTAAGSDTIDGAATFVISNQNNWAILVCDGSSKWSIFSDTVSTAGLAPLASPAFTGIPTAPTASARTNNTQLASTAYVDQAITVYPTVYPSGSATAVTKPIIQCGQSGSISSGGSLAITLGVAFPSLFLSVVATSNTTDGTAVSNNFVQINSTSQFTIFNKQSTTATFTWIAIGN
jgi:hypothetical protein